MSRSQNRWALTAVIIAAQALAAPPPEFTVQGVLRDGSGALQSATVNVTVTLFDAVAAGTKLGGPYIVSSVPVVNGLFTVTVTDAALPGAVNAASGVWMELIVGNDTFPRQKVTTALYAASATFSGDSARLGGVAAGSFAQKTDTAPDSLKLGGVVASGYLTSAAAASTYLSQASATATYQRKLATPDCGVGKVIQAIAADGTVTCSTEATADGTSITASASNALSVAFAGTGAASTAARSDHTHTGSLSCSQVTVAGAAGATAVSVGCTSGGVMTGGGCSSSTGFISKSYQYVCGSRLCFCLPGVYCGPLWECSSVGGTAAEVLTAYAICCTASVP
jgi:hypothetical protein